MIFKHFSDTTSGSRELIYNYVLSILLIVIDTFINKHDVGIAGLSVRIQVIKPRLLLTSMYTISRHSFLSVVSEQ